jgi:hypothetical protein
MRLGKLIVFTIVLLPLLLNQAVVRAATPSPYITESVQASYYPNGTLESPVSGTGIVEVRLPNTVDVLQYIRLDLTTTEGTNLVSTEGYKNVAASPNLWDRTRMYVNTTDSNQDISYRITNPSLMPVIWMSFSKSNVLGGEDIAAGGTNTFDFTVTVNSSLPLSGAVMYLRAARNTLGSNDATSFYDVQTSGGYAMRQDTDGDGMFDRVYWSGDLSSTENVTVTFRGDITPDYNFDESFMYVDFDGGDRAYASYTGTSTFTGISFSNRFSRSAVRQGIEMTYPGTWVVRGFLTNVAEGLDYVIHEWRLYRIGESMDLSSGLPESNLYPGETHTTDWFDTGSSGSFEKQDYFSAYYDWEVVWSSSSFYNATTIAEMYLPDMFEIDSWVSKSAVLQSSGGGSVVTVTDSVRHLGHGSLMSDRIEINSVIPAASVDGTATPWTPSGVSVTYVNGTGNHDITSGSSISTQASSSSDGYVNVVISNLSSLVGNSLMQNQDIVVGYTLSGPARAYTETYNLTQASTIYTLSGTPMTREENDTVTITGVGPGPEPTPGGGGVAPGGATVRHAEIIKEFSSLDIFADNLMGITVRDGIFDDGDRGIRDLKSSIYIPYGGTLDEASLGIRIYDAGTGEWKEWVKGRDYSMVDKGKILLNGREYTEYDIIPLFGVDIFDVSFTLYNGDKIEISYNTTIPFGTNFILTRVYGYNWYNDKYVFEDSYEPVRREGYLEELYVTEGEWIMDNPLVGRPVTWTKWFSAYNPNNVSVKEAYRTGVFRDTISINVMEIGSGAGKTRLELKKSEHTYTDWIMELGPGESVDYMMEVTTPPVMETSRYVDVISSNETIIRFMVNVTLDNFAEEFYGNVSLIFRASPDKILYIIDGPDEYPFSLYDEGRSEIFIGDMESGDKRRLTIVYEEKPPILITAMDAITYGCVDRVNITAIVIPSQSESGSYIEIEIDGPEPEFRTVHANLKEIGKIESWEEMRIPVSMDISELPSGRYFVYTRFKRDFETILSDQIEFTIDCPERDIMSVSWLIFLGAAVAITAYLVFRIRRKKDEAGIEGLKKKLRSLG